MIGVYDHGSGYIEIQCEQLEETDPLIDFMQVGGARIRVQQGHSLVKF